MKNSLKVVTVILGLIFICVSCQKTGPDAGKTQNPAEEYADKLLKAKKDAKDAAGATEQSQKATNSAIDEADKDHKDK
ncbi:MAG: hypothetical protein HQL08_12830 [Nitrospirae bacterium]|nr:hypothetical protein [Nitrospirota bacterium]